MISVDEALLGVLDLCELLDSETVPLVQAAGRILAADAIATCDQPPFAASAMDGYAVVSVDLQPGATLNVIGEAAAGTAFKGDVSAGQAVRIFTGAPVPEGADRVLIQEDCTRTGDQITVADSINPRIYIRPAGGDFKRGDGMKAPVLVGPLESALMASMNIPTVTVRRKPKVALVATGDELVMPGEPPRPDQILSSNTFGLKALVEANGGEAMMLPIARDNEASLRFVLDLAQSADIIVTLGGTSVGDHDLVHKVTGLDLAFYKVAMRPGKSLMAGRLNGTPMIGLPGNPVSAMICGHVVLVPAIRAMLGQGKMALPCETAVLGADIGKNGQSTHYMGARLSCGNDQPTCTPFDRQGSSLLSFFTSANCLLVRKPGDPARIAGQPVDIIRL
ncbi:MAG: molybdopterin molybdotransferase MoeA [Rhodobacteraceae bacterium]|nr:molybdopterin molybdotransferase MoeA [Paracoccaceae bacterium]